MVTSLFVFLILCIVFFEDLSIFGIVYFWGPTVRGPVVRGPTVRGPIVRGPICLEPRWVRKASQVGRSGRFGLVWSAWLLNQNSQSVSQRVSQSARWV